jgi:hypothetical protein
MSALRQKPTFSRSQLYSRSLLLTLTVPRLPRYQCFLLGQERIGLAKAEMCEQFDAVHQSDFICRSFRRIRQRRHASGSIEESNGYRRHARELAPARIVQGQWRNVRFAWCHARTSSYTSSGRRRSATTKPGRIIVGGRVVVVGPQTARNGVVAIDPHTVRRDMAWSVVAWGNGLAGTVDNSRSGMMPSCGGVRGNTESDQKA